MKTKNKHITDIVLDFDGTCTQIPAIYKAYLERYLLELNRKVFTNEPVSPEEWKEVQGIVKKNSPKAPWTVSTTPSAPAGADPYILAFEATKYILRARGSTIMEPPFEVHSVSNDANPAPWRPEARKIFETLLENKIAIRFISNSSSQKIRHRLLDLLGASTLPPLITVQSDAAKFRISELAWDSTIIPTWVRLLFEKLPAVQSSLNIERPVYLRRGSYFEAICKVFNNNLGNLNTTVFCGDIWEMDLAMPKALGAHIHLIKREKPFDTYDYEKDMIKQSRGRISGDLSDLLYWVKYGK